MPARACSAPLSIPHHQRDMDKLRQAAPAAGLLGACLLSSRLLRRPTVTALAIIRCISVLVTTSLADLATFIERRGFSQIVCRRR